jgi:predicted GH43/DUF377 family glycosyl hydrolase
MAVPRLLPQRLTANARRVVVRPFTLSREPRALNPPQIDRVTRIVKAVREMDNRTCQAELALVLADFENRHREIRSVFFERYNEIARELQLNEELREGDKLLIGAFFCHEYSFGAAALMNPSAVPHPNQDGVKPGELRFLMSLRAVGEGHISSIAFREGLLHGDGTITLSPDSDFAVAAGPAEEVDGHVVVRRRPHASLAETVIFPVTPAQRNGIEDLRLVRFAENSGDVSYYGTYTAYSGTTIASEFFATNDFQTIELRPLKGSAARGKGMALFPRKLNGSYAMIGREDNENLFLLHSEDLMTWNGGELILQPLHPWELVQLGNCGSPIEIDEGWLLLTHGVGAMRKYSIGAVLLDKADPTKVLGRSRAPLLSPSDDEREGYVPNVVYTCGALVHAGQLFLPYGIADSAVGFATIALSDVLGDLG